MSRKLELVTAGPVECPNENFVRGVTRHMGWRTDLNGTVLRNFWLILDKQIGTTWQDWEFVTVCHHFSLYFSNFIGIIAQMAFASRYTDSLPKGSLGNPEQICKTRKTQPHNRITETHLSTSKIFSKGWISDIQMFFFRTWTNLLKQWTLLLLLGQHWRNLRP